jgi:hypothetical protein
MGPSGAASCSAKGSSGGIYKRKRKKETYPPAGTSLQGQTYRTNYACKESPVRMCLSASAEACRFFLTGLSLQA